MKIAIVQKAPNSRQYDYSNDFSFDYDLHYLCDEEKKKVYKRDVTLDLNMVKESYDLIILVGSEAMKAFTGKSGVIAMQGALLMDKYVPLINPAMLYFKPEGRDAFKTAVARIENYVLGLGEEELTIVGIRETEEAINYLQNILEQDPCVVALDSETSSLYPREGYILGVSISHKETEGAYIDSDCFDDRCVNILQEIINKHTIVFHNAKFDVKWFQYHFSLNIPYYHDTMLEHYVLDENNGHGLKPLSIRYTTLGAYDEELDIWKKQFCSANGIKVSEFNYSYFPFDVICTYAAKDTIATLRLHNKFYPIILKNSQLNWVYENLLLRGTRFLTKVEEVGCPVDIERLKLADDRLSRRLYKYTQFLYKFDVVKEFEKAQGKKFNPNSVVQLRTLLFDYVGLMPTGIVTAGNEHSTNSEALEILAKSHVIPKVILKIRKTGKILSTYIHKMQREVDSDNRLRTGFNLHVTTSGRLSSSGKLNLQQLPRDDKYVKWSIKARPGYKIVSVDLGTAEMYYVSVLSRDRELQKIFETGGDFHTETAIGIFGLTDAQVLPVEERRKYVEDHYPKLRQASKAISFGILYGSGPDKVADMSGVTVEEARGYIKAYYKKFSRLAKWLEKQKQTIKAQAFIYSAFGRKRRVPNVKSTDNNTAAHEVRSAVNFLVQSVASDVNLLAAMDTQDGCELEGVNANIFALVHDSILAEVQEDHVDQYIKIAKSCIEKDRGISIPNCPVVSDFNVGDDYKEAA